MLGTVCLWLVGFLGGGGCVGWQCGEIGIWGAQFMQKGHGKYNGKERLPVQVSSRGEDPCIPFPGSLASSCPY